jgi:glycerophosphoryl diester phosphodiesterase
MRIIGHRGAAGLAPENTVLALKAGIVAGVDALEFDIRTTSDGHLVLSHDSSLQRMYGLDKKVKDTPLAELKKLRTADGQPLPTLQEALIAAGDTPLCIEGKNGHWAKRLAKVLKEHPNKTQITVISFSHHELFAFSQQCPEIPTLVLEHRNSFDAINAARVYGFDGIDINYWTLNPLTYFLARRHKLEITVFTVNKPWIASFLRVLYPGIGLTTNYPNKMQFLRPRDKRHTAKKEPRARHL